MTEREQGPGRRPGPRSEEPPRHPGRLIEPIGTVCMPFFLTAKVIQLIQIKDNLAALKTQPLIGGNRTGLHIHQIKVIQQRKLHKDS